MSLQFTLVVLMSYTADISPSPCRMLQWLPICCSPHLRVGGCSGSLHAAGAPSCRRLLQLLTCCSLRPRVGGCSGSLHAAAPAPVLEAAAAPYKRQARPRVGGCSGFLNVCWTPNSEADSKNCPTNLGKKTAVKMYTSV